MNRESILQYIQQELAADLAENGQPSPIGEMVPRVALQIRGGAGSSEFQGVLPVWQVAAFVDGELDEAGNEKVCEALKADNSLLAEIIASVRASQMQPSEPLTAALAENLVSLFANQQVNSEGTQPAAGVAALASPATHTSAEERLARGENIDFAPTVVEAPATGRSWTWRSLAAAAVVLLTIGIIGFQVWQGRNETVVDLEPGGVKIALKHPRLLAMLQSPQSILGYPIRNPFWPKGITRTPKQNRLPSIRHLKQ